MTLSLDTRAVHAGDPEPRVMGSVNLPLFQTAMFEYRDGQDRLRYGRYGNLPNQDALAAKLADLTGAEAGLVTASGMAAVSTGLLTILSAGDHLLAAEGLYGGTHDLFTAGLPGMGVDVDFLDANRPDEWEERLRPETRAVYVETISNPLMRVPDLEAVVSFAREHGLTSAVDNTFATPLFCRPLELGFDLEIHSATKYLNGHSDVVAGVLLGEADLVEAARRRLLRLGGALDPHACFLVRRGLQTLPLRVRRQAGTAGRIAKLLDERPEVRAVHYPGLENHPDHERARRLLEGFGGMLSFEMEAGREAAETFLGALEIPVVAPSLGGVESLVTRPAATSHASLSPEEREAAGIRDGLVRMSVGIEGPEDLTEDVARALDQIAAPRGD